MDPSATAGRSVHYYVDDDAVSLSESRAAIVNVDTNVLGMAPELTVFFPDGPKVLTNVSYSEKPYGACWSWMPYQQAKAKTTEGNISESAEPRPPQGGHMASHPEAAQRGDPPKPQPPFSASAKPHVPRKQGPGHTR